MKLHEMKQKRNTIAKDMRALHEKIGDNAWTDEQRAEWNRAKAELDALDEQIAREEELRRQDQAYVDESGPEERQNNEAENGKKAVEEKRAAAFNRFLRAGFAELNAEERNLMRELRAQSVTTDSQGGYTVPTQMRNKIIDTMKAYGGIASVAQLLTTSTGQDITWSTSDGTTEEGELLAENTAATEQDVTFGTAILGAKKLSSKIIRVSNELLQDSGVDIESYLANQPYCPAYWSWRGEISGSGDRNGITVTAKRAGSVGDGNHPDCSLCRFHLERNECPETCH
ncbi:HK97 family phage major capsid protein [Escherichia coli KTE209]|nr:HK97 family phage major capsid protein [Escherichia coli KTE209]ELI79090.1 HK97 family phage major capsid protein [Escherichia coli KTE137]